MYEITTEFASPAERFFVRVSYALSRGRYHIAADRRPIPCQPARPAGVSCTQGIYSHLKPNRTGPLRGPSY